MNFNSARRANFPEVAVPGDLWYATDTRHLYIAAKPENSYSPSTSDFDFVTHVFRSELTVKKGLSANLPASAPIGTIFLTTDTYQAFVAVGNGFPLYEFLIDVRRALRGPVSTVF